MTNEWRANEEGQASQYSNDPLDVGRSRYDSATWRRIYDSFAWRWVVGPIVYITVVGAVWVVIFGNSIADGIAFGALSALLVTVAPTLFERRGDPGDPTDNG